ncbi:Patched domain-containing protein 3 [Toxocara canis]|uniref:Patched domain-containing protein 3 n=1 Tax=Toxocara canis TaxID=6265 RepID=A0A0B2UXL1_TOXCA|nr:Patched domain-containing protein 3 [Toxocara canis]
MSLKNNNSAAGALLAKDETDECDEKQRLEQRLSLDATEDGGTRILARDKNSLLSNGTAGGTKRTKFLSIWRYLTLRGLFQLLGQSVGSYPLVYIALSLLISSCSLGMFKMVLKDRIRDGYTPTNAPSRYEMDVIREFWNSTGDPMMTVVLLTARDGGSMLRDDYFDEVNRLHNYLLNNLTVVYGTESIKYRDLCAPYCNVNIALQLLKQGLDYEKVLLRLGKELSSDTTLTYPVARIDGLEVHLERNLFGIRTKEAINKKAYVGQKMTPDKLPKNMTYSQMLTNLDFVKVILIIYRGDKATVDLDKKLSLWELAVFEFGREKYNNNLIDMQVIGTEILDQEMIKDGQKMTPYFAAGFAFMMVFVTVTVLMSAIFYNAMDWGKALVACGAILCPILSITTTYGLVSLFRIRTNSFMLVMPFLIMGIGVDDGFLMMHAWQRLALHCSSVPLRLGMVFEEVGPSITITSLTNFISFGIGAFTPTPEIRLFCIATAIAMGLDYLYELILFGPVLAIAARCERKRSSFEKQSANSMHEPLHGWRLKIDSFMKCVLKYYCRIIGHRIFTIALIGATVIYWYFAILGALTIKTRLDTVKILPKDSPIQAPNRILNDIIWAEYHPVTILVNKELDIRDRAQMNRFWHMVDEFEGLPNCRGNISTLLWLRDYQTFYERGAPMDLFSLFGFDRSTSPPKVLNDPTKTGLDYDKLEDFLQSPFYKHWSTFVRITHTSEGPRVSRFWFTVAYWNTSTWEKRIEIMQTWRKIAEEHKDLNVTVWEANGMFVDQMLSLKTVAVQTGVLTLICMAVVCAIFIPNPCSVITASIAIASISLGVFGFLSWWHFDLDPVTMAAVLMSIGLSVDFTAHVSYHYQLTNRKEVRNGKIVKIPMEGQQEKLEHTLQSVGWPMIQAGASTVMCVLPLLFLQSYSPMVFVKTIFLVVAWGLLHGLIVLPAFLGALPKCLTDANCYRTFLSTSSQRSCRYVGPADCENADGQEMDNSEQYCTTTA